VDLPINHVTIIAFKLLADLIVFVSNRSHFAGALKPNYFQETPLLGKLSEASSERGSGEFEGVLGRSESRSSTWVPSPSGTFADAPKLDAAVRAQSLGLTSTLTA
jgi:hypothetical protein